MSKNNETAFNVYYKEHSSFVRRLCQKKMPQHEAAMDLESIVWVEVHKSFERFDRESPRGLLKQLINWRAKDLYRQLYRPVNQNQELFEDEQASQLHQRASNGCTAQEAQGAVDQTLDLFDALASEDEESVELLVDRFVKGYSWEELSQKYKVHRNTLLNRSNATLGRLRSQLGSKHFSSFGTINHLLAA